MDSVPVVVFEVHLLIGPSLLFKAFVEGSHFGMIDVAIIGQKVSGAIVGAVQRIVSGNIDGFVQRGDGALAYFWTSRKDIISA